MQGSDFNAPDRGGLDWPRLALWAVVLASAGLALTWVYLVPIYQSPDEPAHLDYALAINAHRGLLRPNGGTFDTLPGAVHPYTDYLRKRTNAAWIHFHPERKMPPDYGRMRYFRALDHDAPPFNAWQVNGPSQLMAVYPFGYYAALAGWIEGLRLVRETPVFIFFGSRLFSVLLLVGSLFLTHATARLLHLKPWTAVFVTACVGLFPLTSFVCSYVQPDNLGFLLVSLNFYLALRARQEPGRLRLIALLGLASGALLVTKPHFCASLGLPVTLMLAVEMYRANVGRWRKLAATVLYAAPGVVALAAYLWFMQGTTTYYAPPAEKKSAIYNTLYWSHLAVLNYFAQFSHETFWGMFGWVDTPLKFGKGRTTEIIQYLTNIVAWVVVALTLVRLEQVASRLYRLWRRGRRWLALHLAFSNPVLNGYFLFTALMLFLFVRLENRFAAQGRNWLPFLLPIFLVGLAYAPRALTLRRSRLALSAVLAASLFAYCLVGSYYAIRSVRQRYYEPSAPAANLIQARSASEE